MSNPIRRVACAAAMAMATPVAAQPGPPTVAIEHVTVVPMTRVPYLRDQTVVRGRMLDRRELDGMLRRAREFAARCTGIIRCGDVSAAPGRSCAVAERPGLTERLFRLFNSTDSLLVVAHSMHGIHAQPSTTRHGVLRDTDLCARVRAALRQNIVLEDAVSGVPADSLLSFHDLGAYLVVHIDRPRAGGVRMSDSGTPI